jgi:predicted transcriptional regulator
LHRRVLVAFALLAGLAATAAADPKAHASFSYDGPSSHRGTSEGSCDAVGIQLPPVPIELRSEGGTLVVRRTFINWTVLGPGDGLVAHGGPTEMREERIPIPGGTVRLAAAASGLIVGFPYSYSRGPDATFEARWNATRVDLSAPETEIPSPAGDVWIRGADAILPLASAFPGWARLVGLEGDARAGGDLTLYVRQADVQWDGGARTLGPYRTQTANASTAAGSYRSIENTDAFLDLNGVSFVLPPGSEPACRSLHARVDGLLTVEGATGTLPSSSGPRAVSGRAVTLAGDFALEETPPAQAPVRGSAGRMDARADGDIGLVAVDFAKVADPSTSKAVAAAGLGAALLVVALAVARYAGALVGLFYSRFGRERALDNRNREIVYEAVLHNPGVDFSTLAQITGMNRRTVAYHVQVLTRVNLIGTRRHGRSRRLFPTHLTGQESVASILAARDPRFARLVDALRTGPMATSELVRRLREQLGLGRRAAYYVVERALDHGIVSRSEDGREVKLKCEASP